MLNLYDASRFMRNIHRHILLALLSVLCFGSTAAAAPQSDNYDKALDKYAYICGRCLEMRAKVESGQSIQMESLGSLLAELSLLRKTLSNASGKMSVAQAARFEAIKVKYMQGMKAVEKKPRPAFSSIKKIKPVPEPVEVASVTRQTVSLQRLVSPVEPQAQRPERQARSPKLKTHLPKEGFKMAVLADAGIFPVPSYGAMAVMTWNGIGAYANYRSDFRTNEYSYTCSSEGDTEYGRIWATGESRVSRTVATAGFAMFISRRLGFYAGGGLTSFTRCWEDVSGQWARVGDKSFRGLAVDCGIFLTFRAFSVSVGVTSDFSGHVDTQLGVGFRL